MPGMDMRVEEINLLKLAVKASYAESTANESPREPKISSTTGVGFRPKRSQTSPRQFKSAHESPREPKRTQENPGEPKRTQ